MKWSLYPVVLQVQSVDLQTGLPRGVHYKQKTTTPRGRINHDLNEGKINLNGQDEIRLELKENGKVTQTDDGSKIHPFIHPSIAFVAKTVKNYHVPKKYNITNCSYTLWGIF